MQTASAIEPVVAGSFVTEAQIEKTTQENDATCRLGDDSVLASRVRLDKAANIKQQAADVTLTLEPIHRIAYAGRLLGLRLRLKGPHAEASGFDLYRGGMIVKIENGLAGWRKDNSIRAKDSADYWLDPQPKNVEILTPIRYDPGTRLVLFDSKGKLVDAVVENGHETFGSRHLLTLGAASGTTKSAASRKGSSAGRSVLYDLNELNHCCPRFDSVSAYDAARVKYFDLVLKGMNLIEDAITGNKLRIGDQLLLIRTQGKGLSSNLSDVKGVASLLLCDWLERAQGRQVSQPILIIAPAGTGKTWTTLQLCVEVAQRAKWSVPLVIPVQKLARCVRENPSHPSAVSGSYVHLFIEIEFAGQMEVQKVLLQAYDLRLLLILIDGVDEAAALRKPLEQFLSLALVQWGGRMVVTSRPEGLTLSKYQQQRFIVLTLEPLTAEQQSQMINTQLGGSEFFKQ